MKKNWIALLLALCLLFTLAACKPGGTAEESPSPSPAASVEPTQEATPSPEPTPEPAPDPTPTPEPTPQYPLLLDYEPLTETKLWLAADGTLRLEKGSLWGTPALELPEKYVSAEVVDADADDTDVSIHILTPDETIIIDLLWSEEEQSWVEGALTSPSPTLNIAEEPPLNEAALALDVPDFLTEEQQLLYRKAYFLYSHMFGGDTQYIDYFDADSGYATDTVNYGVHTYQLAAGRYKNWADFDETVHSVFTDDFWQEKCGFSIEGSGLYSTYMEYDGRLAILSVGRGGGWYNDNFADKFQLVSKSDTAIEFIVTGHYSCPYPLGSESYEERDQRVATSFDFVLDFTIRMVLTEDGWRFDQYGCAQTDDYLYSGLQGNNT